MDTDKRYREVSLKTGHELLTIAHSVQVRDLSRLSLPEVDKVVDLVARVIPAGNVPAMILSGLTRLSGKRPPPQIVKRDINLLFKGVEQTLDKALYGALFAGPAAIIWGYQHLLKLAGQNPDDSFPEGTWQFYVDYALRDDTARHTNETHGFDTALRQRNIRLDSIDRVTAWVMAAIYCLHQYDALLENEWRERVHTFLVREATQNEPDAARYVQLYRHWTLQRPYRRGPDAAPGQGYAAYRREKFDRFLADAMRDLPDELCARWREQAQAAERRDLAAYQRQMSILAYLDPGAYGETRTPITIAQAHVGLIHQGRYYLIPACSPKTERPADVATVRAQVAALMRDPLDTLAVPLTPLAQVKRSAFAHLRNKLSRTVIAELDTLRLAPILLNSDPRPSHLPLAELRQAERGVGDHALTLFDTGLTCILDQSHIFFDGAWGVALAEILTNEATDWAIYLSTLPPAQPAPTRPRALACQFQAADLDLIRQSPHVATEVSAENAEIDLQAIVTLRQLFKQRSDLLRLTVNDLLVLYRAIHAATYQPALALIEELNSLARENTTRPAALAALEAMDSSTQSNPAILIPVDASRRSPRDRLYPVTYEVPLGELDLLNLHGQVIAALDIYGKAAGDRSAAYAEFDRLQRIYLATLAGFGEVMSKVKDLAIQGQSASAGTIKLLAHMPAPLQRLLDQVPGYFDVLNDIIKGREVFSNVGAVVPTSTLTRFITAKDDNEKKTLAWGIMTDAGGTLRITLRDFRSHVGLLQSVGRRDVAIRIAQDYVDAYASGLNRHVCDWQRITQASRETRLKRE